MHTHPVLANHDLFDGVALAELDEVRSVERAGDLAARDESQALDALKVGVLDAHDALRGEKALWVVVDELAVDKAGDAVRLDFGHFGLHLLPLCPLELCELARPVDLHLCPKDLDFIRVHGRVCNHDFRILNPARAVDRDLLVEDEPFVEVRVAQLAACLLDDLDVVEVGRAFQAEDGADGELGKVVLVRREDL